MMDNAINIQQSEISIPAIEKKRKPAQYRWKKRIKIRAAKIKRQLQIENRFHQAMTEMRTTRDAQRQSYLHWILNHMFTTFDYETGLQAINDKAAYHRWLADNAQGYRD